MPMPVKNDFRSRSKASFVSGSIYVVYGSRLRSMRCRVMSMSLWLARSSRLPSCKRTSASRFLVLLMQRLGVFQAGLDLLRQLLVEPAIQALDGPADHLAGVDILDVAFLDHLHGFQHLAGIIFGIGLLQLGALENHRPVRLEV